MNIYAERNAATAAMFDSIFPEIKKAASESKAPTQTRGSPEGKASRVPAMDEYSTNAMQWAYSDKTAMGEQKMFYRKGKWVLLEKSNDGLSMRTRAKLYENIFEIRRD